MQPQKTKANQNPDPDNCKFLANFKTKTQFLIPSHKSKTKEMWGRERKKEKNKNKKWAQSFTASKKIQY